MFFVLKQAWARTFRPLSICITRVALAFVLTSLVTMFWAVQEENTTGLARFYRGIQFDYVASQAGDNTEVFNSLLPDEFVSAMRSESNLKVAGMGFCFGHMSSQDILYSSYEPGTFAQPRLATGRHVQTSDEALVDRYLADDLGVKLGQVIPTSSGRPLHVVGLSDGSDSFTRRRIFVSHGGMAAICGTEAIKLLLVEGQPGSELTQRWQDQVTFYDRDQWFEGAANYGRRNVTPLVVTVIEVVSSIVIFALTGFLIYQMGQLKREISLLRALGASRRQIGAIESTSLTGTLVIGYILGIFGGWGFIALANAQTPGFHAVLTISGISIAAGILAGIGALGLIPVVFHARRSMPMEFLRAQ